MTDTTSMRDRICLVTGGTAGIGRVTARELARRGAQVVIVGRDSARGERAVRELRAESGNDWVSFQRADLSRMGDVRRLARNIVEQHPRLDVLVNNAGAIFSTRRVTAEGFEMTFALNHLNYFLLTNLLLDRLRAAPAGRIVNVASRAHEGVSLHFDDLQSERRYEGRRVYRRSKLCNILFTYELARRLEGTGVTTNALHPGFVASRFGSDNGPLFRFGMRLAFLLARAIDVERGAETSVHLAVAPELAGISGRYFVRRRETESSPQSHDRAAAERLWAISERLTAGR